ncbi:hypothetical protein ABK040_011371 [Willaertia magna]
MVELTIDQVLEKMREFLEMPEDQQPKECPFSEEKKVFVQHNQQLVTQCPAFHSHKCPFDHIHDMEHLKKKISNIPSLKTRCPVMAESHPNSHGKLVDILEYEAEKKQ